MVLPCFTMSTQNTGLPAIRGVKNENSLVIVDYLTGKAPAEIHPQDMVNPPKLKPGLVYQTPGVYLAGLNTRSTATP